MNIFYGVTQNYFDNGEVLIREPFSVASENKPDNKYIVGKHRDIYVDYFNDYESARDFFDDCKRAVSCKTYIG